MDAINVKQIKEVNNQCNMYKKKASDLLAEKEYKTKALNEMCARLSEILGIQVTTANLEEVYQQRVAKIQSTLQVCNDMIERIKLQESGVAVPPVKEDVKVEIPTMNVAGNNSVDVVGNNSMGVGNNSMGVVGNTVNEIKQTEQSVVNANLSGLPTSDYKIPESMLDMMPNRGQAVQGQAVQGQAVQGQAVQGQAVQGQAVQGQAVKYTNLGGTVNLKNFINNAPKNDVEDIY